MLREIDDTTLVVTAVLYQESRTSLLREERGETVTLMRIRDEATGREGHLFHEIAVDKRDIEQENFWTDTPELFADQHPEAVSITELSGCGPEGTPAERSDEIDEIVGACLEHSLEYRAENPDAEDYEGQAWGLYPES